MHAEIWFGNLKGKGVLEGLGVDGRILLKRILTEIVCEVGDWILLVQDRDQRWAVRTFGFRIR
jgi:hypothetical protein